MARGQKKPPPPPPGLQKPQKARDLTIIQFWSMFEIFIFYLFISTGAPRSDVNQKMHQISKFLYKNRIRSIFVFIIN